MHLNPDLIGREVGASTDRNYTDPPQHLGSRDELIRSGPPLHLFQTNANQSKRFSSRDFRLSIRELKYTLPEVIT